MGFYRLGIFAKLEIVASNLTGVLCFQALGSLITFYTMVHPCSSMFTFVELVTINMPRTKNNIMSLMGFLDELHKIAVYHRTLVKSLAPNAEHPTLSFEFMQGAKKKHCQLRESLLWDQSHPNSVTLWSPSYSIILTHHSLVCISLLSYRIIVPILFFFAPIEK